MSKIFLLLQGPQGPFFKTLYRFFTSRGYSTYKINFNGGDLLFSLGCNPINYNGTLEEWKSYCSKFLIEKGITDLILYNDCRPLHRVAIELAQARGCRVHILEEGYLRPNWITLEEDGVNGFSTIPRYPEWYLSKASELDSEPEYKVIGPSLSALALYCILYHALVFVLYPFFGKYKSHRPYTIAQDMLGWIRRVGRLYWERKHAALVQNTLSSTKKDFVLFALQLSSDSQIWQHSPYRDNIELIDEVLLSFKKYAPSDLLLVIKNHPLDSGVVNYRKYIARQAKHLGIAERVDYISGGHLPTLMKLSSGVVLVNSTVGMSALHHNVPTIALGNAIYNFSGLTFQGGLDKFWTEREMPDRQLYSLFRLYLLKRNQVNGNFYVRLGMETAILKIAEKIIPKDNIDIIRRKHLEHDCPDLPLMSN